MGPGVSISAGGVLFVKIFHTFSINSWALLYLNEVDLQEEDLTDDPLLDELKRLRQRLHHWTGKPYLLLT